MPVVPERSLIGLPRLVEEQRRDEKDEEQLGVERHRDLLLCEKRYGNAAGYLNQGKRQARQKLVDHGGSQHGSQEHQCKLECRHSPCLLNVFARNLFLYVTEC